MSLSVVGLWYGPLSDDELSSLPQCACKVPKVIWKAGRTSSILHYLLWSTGARPSQKHPEFWALELPEESSAKGSFWRVSKRFPLSMFFSVLLRLWKAVILGHARCHWTKGTCSVLRGFHEVKEPLNCRLQNSQLEPHASATVYSFLGSRFWLSKPWKCNVCVMPGASHSNRS